MPKINLYGHPTNYESDEDPGYIYIARKINRDEAEVLFRHAREHGSAQFEDQMGKNYSLVYNRSEGNYSIVKR